MRLWYYINSNFILILIKIVFILKNKNSKKDTFIINDFSYLQITFALLVKIILFYTKIFII